MSSVTGLGATGMPLLMIVKLASLMKCSTTLNVCPSFSNVPDFVPSSPVNSTTSSLAMSFGSSYHMVH